LNQWISWVGGTRRHPPTREYNRNQTRMKKQTVIIAGLAVIVIGMVMSVAFRPEKPPASVTLLGFTNDVAGTRLGRFVVSNLNSSVVRRQAGYWIELPTPTGGTNRASCWFSSSHDLNARAFEVVAVPVPTNEPSWRVLLSIRTDLGRVTETMHAVGFMVFGFRSTFLERKSYELRSDWMKN
jgi:hypothetical protein